MVRATRSTRWKPRADSRMAAAASMCKQGEQVGRGDHVELSGPARFAALDGGADQPFVERRGVDRGEQHAGRGGDAPVEAKLADRDSASVAPIAASRHKAIGKS